MIAIYDGPGTKWKGKIFHRKVNKSQILQGELETVQTLIMPGGRDQPYHKELQGEANRLIRKFVENGGTYLGICAGAYYGCKLVEFDRGFPLEVYEKRELCFFNGTAKGPVYGEGTFAYNSEKGARRANITFQKSSQAIYYNGGPTFIGDFSNVKILGYYLDLPKNPPAIIECVVGKGKAILSGVHLELSHLTKGFSPDQMEMEMKNHLPCIRAIIG